MRPSDRQRRTWARQWVEAVAGLGDTDPKRPVELAVAAVDRSLRGDTDPFEIDSTALAVPASLDTLPAPPGGWANPWLPGVVNEQSVVGEARSARGAWYTPESVVRGLVRLATPGQDLPDRIVDPTCGGGAFLLAALDRCLELGLSAEQALSRVGGTDADPGAVWTARWSLALWGRAQGVDVEPDDIAVELGDALEAGPASGSRLVVGNPPFATPLRSGRLSEAAEAYRTEHRSLLGPYADLAAIHLLAAVRSCGPGSTVVMIQPQSVLAGRDTEDLRAWFQAEAPLQALWATRQSVFDAGVRACAVVLAPGASGSKTVSLAAGPTVEPVDPLEGETAGPEPRWSVLAARALGAPRLPAALARAQQGGEAGGEGLGRLGQLVTATAGFRDEYYGLVEACREWHGSDADAPNRLVTVGSLDPLSTSWGVEPCRFGGRRWLRPTIDLDALAPKVRRWVDQRAQPKVVLATQSRLLEPVVDRDGDLVPATPLVSLSAAADDLDRVAAVLLAPPVLAWAWQRWFGSALSVDAVKLAARQVLELPLPPDREAWEEAAGLVATADGLDPAGAAAVAAEVGELMNQAYGAGDEVLDWWRARGGGPR